MKQQRQAGERETMKRYRLRTLVLAIALTFTMRLLLAEAGPVKRIGILVFSEETRYNDATRGLIDQLKTEGFAEPGVKFIKENAGANKAKAAEFIKQFAGAKLDLIVTQGTSATVPVAREIKDVPIVFSMVYDPVEAGIAKDWKSSGNNTTGATTKIPMSNLLDSLKAFAPVKYLSVLYSPGEKNSEAQLRDLQKIQAMHRITIIPVPITEKEELRKILPEVVRTSDAIYVTGSNIVDSQVSMIVEMAAKGKVPTISHLEDLVEKGVLIGVCINPYNLGRLAGEKAASVLRGAKPSSIPIETLKESDVILNMRTAIAGGFRIPSEFIKTVKRKID
jgi:putative tryptophan/tyrosine transport system substrate-binding protein